MTLRNSKISVEYFQYFLGSVLISAKNQIAYKAQTSLPIYESAKSTLNSLHFDKV